MLRCDGLAYSLHTCMLLVSDNIEFVRITTNIKRILDSMNTSFLSAPVSINPSSNTWRVVIRPSRGMYPQRGAL